MNKKFLIYALIAIIILGIGLRMFSLNKDFSAEEVDFVLAARAIDATGHPIYYQAEQDPDALALWHPPMYIYVLSIVTALTNSEILTRSVNFIFSILTALLIYFFCNRFFPNYGKISGLIASALFLLNFYVLSSSLLIDIDCFSTFFIFGFIYASLLFFEKEKISYAILSVIFLIFSFANRWPIAILIYSIIFLYLLLNKDIKKNISLSYFLIGLLSGAIFLIIWAIYSNLIEPGNFFSFIRHNASLSSEQFQSLTRYGFSFLLNMAQIIRLFTLPVLILFFLSAVHFVKIKELKYRVLLLYALSIFVLFIIVPRPAFGYPRYFFSLMPGLFIMISVYLCDIFKTIKSTKQHFNFFIAFLVISGILLILLHPQVTIYRNDGLIKATNLPDLILNILCSAPLLLLLPRRYRKIDLLLIGLLALFLTYSLYFGLGYAANEGKIKEAGSYLAAHTPYGEKIIAPKAIGTYYGGKFYANDYYKPPMDDLSEKFLMQYLKKSYTDPAMEDSFFWGKNIYGGTEYNGPENVDKQIVNSTYLVVNYYTKDLNLEKKIGDYYIYKLRAA